MTGGDLRGTLGLDEIGIPSGDLRPFVVLNRRVRGRRLGSSPDTNNCMNMSSGISVRCVDIECTRCPSAVTLPARLIRFGLLLAALAALSSGCSHPRDAAADYDYGRPDRARLPKMTQRNHDAIMADLFGEPSIPVKTIGILVFDGVDTVEALGPMAVLSTLMNVQLEYVGTRTGRQPRGIASGAAATA